MPRGNKRGPGYLPRGAVRRPQRAARASSIPSKGEHMFAMAHPAYIREKARAMRAQRKLTIDELAERLALSRSTVYYWVKDLPIERQGRPNAGQRRGSRAMQRRYRLIREDFVCLYIAEGSKRNRNQVAICNSDAAVLQLATKWLARLANNPLRFSIQYHADQDLNDLRGFWSRALTIDPDSIRLQRKSNSRQLKGRHWRSRHGVLAAAVSDTLLRARLQAWMDRLRASWLNSQGHGA